MSSADILLVVPPQRSKLRVFYSVLLVLTFLYPISLALPIMASNKNDKSEQYVPPSNNSIYQTYGGWPGPWNDDDVQEGKAMWKG
jgi:hypothetical protein